MNNKEYDLIKKQCDILDELSYNLRMTGNSELASIIGKINKNIIVIANRSLDRENKVISDYVDMSIKNSIINIK